ncbi:hypothetical protein EWM64_g3406 [Hericium alpestre]|uniref:BSD domain-containing protein n=1 Tax=Hericium alpestre TaxID=135208 RepID=A0A4Z0A1N6_9AGAM|nr:hypothetical protein EWM64_g3406 [Hericium alpestre]
MVSKHLLLAQAAADSQRKGRPGQLVDPRPQAIEGGDVKIVVTPQLVHDIFEEYPVVAKAYDENVPNKLSEGEFWKRYFQSKLFHSHRASIRSTAAQHVVKDDIIFDKYLEKPDDELEPRRQRDEDIDMFIDLGATHEDHDENAYYMQIDLDDLHDPQSSEGILLQMQDRQRYFEGRVGAVGAAEEAPRLAVDMRAALREAKFDLQDWSNSLSQLKLDRKAVDTALMSMTQNVAARLDIKGRKRDIPEDIFRQMRTCQTAANEFLRQFWSSIYPSTAELQSLAPATPAQKAAKAARMATYLSKTPEKVMAIVVAAQKAGVDHRKVEIGMKPIMDAVDKALAFWQTRKPKS